MPLKDRRYRKTEAVIKKAFVLATIKRDFSFPDVNEIIEIADINKSTFYLHYQNVQQVCRALEDDFISELLTLGISNDMSIQNLGPFLNFVKERMEVTDVILSLSFSQFISKILPLFSALGGRRRAKLEDLDKIGIYYHIFGIIHSWCRNKCRVNIDDLKIIIGDFSFKS